MVKYLCLHIHNTILYQIYIESIICSYVHTPKINHNSKFYTCVHVTELRYQNKLTSSYIFCTADKAGLTSSSTIKSLVVNDASALFRHGNYT